MQLNHVGIINKSKEHAIRFYKDFLGFKIAKESVVPAELSVQLFGVSGDINVVVFERDGIKLEVFISPGYKPASPDITHTGIFLENLSEITEKAAEAGVELVIGKTKDKIVHFLRDFSGNLVEIKQM